MPDCLDDLPRDIDIVFHGAAILGVQQVLDAPDRVLEINAASTLNVFNFARQLTGLKRVVFASTSEVYAGTLKHFGIPFPTPESVPICVDDLRLARTSYALSKVYGEAVAFAWRKSHDLPVTVVRYHNVYGPRMGFRHVVPQTFVKIAQSTQSVDVPSAHHTRAFCYVEDAVEANDSMLGIEASGRRDCKYRILVRGNLDSRAGGEDRVDDGTRNHHS